MTNYNIRTVVDPYVRDYDTREGRSAIRMEEWDNLDKYERERGHYNDLYGEGLYNDEWKLRNKGYTGKVSPLVRRKGVNNRYR